MRSNPGIRSIGIIALMLTGAHPVWAQQETASVEGPGSSYSSLRPQQKRLIDDWFTRVSAVVQKPVDPAEGYELLPLSTRTTFNAVTHSLLMTRLTDSSGASLSDSAIELVDKLDDAAGQILGSRGDRQFRIYVRMKPGALDLLGRSQEFSRSADNTVYHKGYPICFRSTGGTPSIQFSLSRDASSADIDVDYRSSKFPAALFNGHLTASNSDIRASGNDAKHNQQWSGMQNWWSNFLGLPLAETFRLGTGSDRVIPATPRRKGGPAADSVYDFLSGWLVEQKPEEAIAYFAQQSYACVDVQGKSSTDPGVVGFLVLQRMIAANALVGKMSSLSDAVVGVAVSSERLKLIQQPRHATFVLYDVREDLAEEFKCVNRLDSSRVSPKALQSRSFGKYVGAMFTIKGNQQTAARMVATLWQREGGYWKLISYEVDPEIDDSRVPNLRATVAAEAPLEYVPGDRDMVRAASNFLREWLVRKNVEKALEFTAPESLACVALYRADDVPAPSTPAEARALLKTGMARAAEAIGSVRRLEGAIVAPDVHHRALKLVKHPEDTSFVVASIPESMGVAADCERRRPDGDPDFSGAQPAGYGTYYAAGFNVSNGNMDPATLWTVWSKASGSWKVTSYVLLSP